MMCRMTIFFERRSSSSAARSVRSKILGWQIRFDSNTIQYGRPPNRINTLRYDTHTPVRRIVLTSPASCNTPLHSSRAARSLLSSSQRQPRGRTARTSGSPRSRCGWRTCGGSRSGTDCRRRALRRRRLSTPRAERLFARRRRRASDIRRRSAEAQFRLVGRRRLGADGDLAVRRLVLLLRCRLRRAIGEHSLPACGLLEACQLPAQHRRVVQLLHAGDGAQLLNLDR